MRTKVSIAILALAFIITLAGCINMQTPPVIGNMIATNEYGIYAVGLKAYVADDNAMLVWDTGDGKKEYGANPTHDYDEPGEYTVVLTATIPYGLSSTKELQIAVHYNEVCFFENVQPGFPWWCEPPQTVEDWEL